MPDSTVSGSPSHSPDSRTPLSVGFGASRSFGSTRLYLSAEWFQSIGPYEILDTEPFEAQSNGRSISSDVIQELDSVTNVAIGIGVLLGSWLSGQSDTEPVRYEVRLDGGGEMTIYHDSPDFEVDDCVEIKVYPDEEKNPPSMKRNKGACAS